MKFIVKPIKGVLDLLTFIKNYSTLYGTIRNIGSNINSASWLA